MNVKLLADNLGVEEDEFRELAELFVDSTNQDLQNLNAAIDAGNTENAVLPAHSIKGAAGSLGFNDIYATAQTIEQKTKDSELSGIADDLQTLKHQVDELARSLASL